jgi:hypothetical protein
MGIKHFVRGLFRKKITEYVGTQDIDVEKIKATLTLDDGSTRTFSVTGYAFKCAGSHGVIFPVTATDILHSQLKKPTITISSAGSSELYIPTDRITKVEMVRSPVLIAIVNQG